MKPTLGCSFYTQWDSIGERLFSFASGYQVQIASWLGVGAVSTSPSSAATPSGENWRMPPPVSESLCAPVRSWLEDTASLEQHKCRGEKGRWCLRKLVLTFKAPGATLGRTTEVGRRRRGRHNGTRNKPLFLNWPFLHNLQFSLATVTCTSLQRCVCRYVYVHMSDTAQKA